MKKNKLPGKGLLFVKHSLTTFTAVIEYHGVTLNATQMLQRTEELTQLSEVAINPNFHFKAPRAGPENWAEKEDTSLLDGIYKFGFGNWKQMCN